MAELESAKNRCKSVIDRIGGFRNCSDKITDSSLRTLLKLAVSELIFLSSSSSLTSSRSVNIGHIEAVLHILQQPFVTGVSCVCKPIPSPASVHVDIVCTLHKNPVWIVVSDRNPKHISWNESHKNKGLKSRIEQLLNAARSSVVLEPASILLFFSKGVSPGICEKVKAGFGAEESGLEFCVCDFDLDEDSESDWVNVRARMYKEAVLLKININGIVQDSCLNRGRLKDSISEGIEKDQILDAPFFWLISKMSLCSLVVENENPSGEADIVNFDTTALIALVSGISNGGAGSLLAAPEAELRLRFKGNYEFVIGQAKSEIQNPIHVKFGNLLPGKRCIICQSVYSEFMELVAMCGGPNEKLRAEQLLRCIKVVPDCPSERVKSLPTTRKLALKNKIVFGTGDSWRAPTLTANMGFVRAISQTGMSLFTIAHKPRALTGD